MKALKHILIIIFSISILLLIKLIFSGYTQIHGNFIVNVVWFLILYGGGLYTTNKYLSSSNLAGKKQKFQTEKSTHSGKTNG